MSKKSDRYAKWGRERQKNEERQEQRRKRNDAKRAKRMMQDSERPVGVKSCQGK